MAAVNDNNEDSNVVKRIRVLLMSDIHLNTRNIAKVNEYISSSSIKIDHLWAPGDFMNLKEADNDDEKKLNQAENDLVDILNELRKIHPNPVIIGGNHDPKTLFLTENEKYFNFGECVNIHKKLYTVDGETNLFMAGFGGSVPALCEAKPIWSGYPFSDETEFGKEFNPFIQEVLIDDKNNVIKTKKSVILFTHNGPSMSSTAMDWRNNDRNKLILTGSEHITDALLNEKVRDKLVCNIHGHSHLGVGQARIGSIKIINPGSCSGKLDGKIDACNNFAIVDLIQFKDETWDVAEVQFVKM